jgi:hypothetical protein
VTGQKGIAVTCTAVAEGFRCQVTVGDDPGRTTHQVTVRARDLERFARGGSDPVALLTASFDFLLENEPREAILRQFDLAEIERYYPSYPREILARIS